MPHLPAVAALALLLAALWLWARLQPEAQAGPLCPCGCGNPPSQHNPPRSA